MEKSGSIEKSKETNAKKRRTRKKKKVKKVMQQDSSLQIRPIVLRNQGAFYLSSDGSGSDVGHEQSKLIPKVTTFNSFQIQTQIFSTQSIRADPNNSMFKLDNNVNSASNMETKDSNLKRENCLLKHDVKDKFKYLKNINQASGDLDDFVENGTSQ